MADMQADRQLPDEPLDIDQIAETLLEEARSVDAGRASKSLTPVAHAPLKQNLVALQGGAELSDYTLNGPATIYLVRGSVTIDAGNGGAELRTGHWAAFPAERHDLRADEDTVALITVAPVGEATEIEDGAPTA